jgi:hypothetical protein
VRLAWTVFITCLCVGCRVEPSAEWNLALLGPKPVWQNNELYLAVGLDWGPSPGVVEALEHGVAVPLRITTRVARYYRWFAIVDEDRHHRLEIRYLPLVRSYQLHDLASGRQQNFPRLAMLAEALREPRRWPTGLDSAAAQAHAWQVQLRAELDRSRLPSPMRIPVWFDPQWRVVSDWQTWLINGDEAPR